MEREDIALQFGPVSSAAEGPLYAQVTGNIRREIVAGRLQPNDALPSTRILAAALSVSVITVSRAYEELERAGIVFSRQGLGTFVTSDAHERLCAGETEIRDLLDRVVELARHSPLTNEQILAILSDGLSRKRGGMTHVRD